MVDTGALEPLESPAEAVETTLDRYIGGHANCKMFATVSCFWNL